MEMNVIACQAKDKNNRDAWETLLKHCEPVLRIIAKHYYIPKDDYEDVIQEAHIGLLRAVQDYDINSNVPFMLFLRIVVNRKLIDAVKIKNSYKHRLFNSSHSVEGFISEDDGNPYDYLQLSSQIQDFQDPQVLVSDKFHHHYIIETIVSTLTPLELDVFKSYFLRCMKPAEISKCFNITTKSIDNTLRRIKLKLRQYQNEFLIPA